jgi:hypothetical protein
MDNLIWGDDFDDVYGLTTDYDNIMDFQRCIHNFIKKNLTDIKKYEIKNLTERTCVMSGGGLEAERVVPIEFVDININKYYHCDIEELDE